MSQLKSTLISLGALVLLVLVVFVAINLQEPGDNQRSVSGQYGASADFPHGVPQGHSYKEKEELWHLSEGADFMPLRWFLNIRSVFDHENSNRVSRATYIYEQLQTKFGVVETNNIPVSYDGGKSYNSPMKWLGLSLAWSEPVNDMAKVTSSEFSVPTKPDSDAMAHTVLHNIDRTGLRPVSNSRFGGEIEVPMVGTNCTLCHSNLVRFKNESGSGFTDAFIEGAPALLNVRNLFRDFGGGTFRTMLDPELMTEYLVRIIEEKKMVKLEDVEASVGIAYKTPQGTTALTTKERAEQVALTFNEKLMRDLEGVPDWSLRNEQGKLDIRELDGLWATARGLFATAGGLRGNTKKWVMQRALGFMENRPVLSEHFGRFLAISYGVPYQTILDTPSLKARMDWLGTLLTVDPKIATTPEGYGRTDAFGRISNAVARGDNPLPLIAPVSFPPMWGMRFSNLFHYNGNTNSVLMRNIGQSFGLGALVFDADDGLPPDSQGRPLVGSNLVNLNRLEKHLYNIKYPEWNKLAPDHLKIDTNDGNHFKQVQLGCEVYANKCMGCHDSSLGGTVESGVGPQGTLVKHFVHKLQRTQTDPNHNIIQKTPVLAGNGTEVPFRRALFEMTKKVKERYMEDMGLTDSEVALWENREHRGQEHFRDTWLGENFKCFEDIEAGRSGECWLQTVFNIDTPTDYRSDYELKYMALANKSTGERLKRKYGYIAKSLAGIWATPPFLHNGTIPTVEHLINPSLRRPSKFYVGCRVYDDEKLGFIWKKRDWNQVGSQAPECEPTEEDHLLDTRYKVPQNIVINGEAGSFKKYNRNGRYVFDENGEFIWHKSFNLIKAGFFTNGNYNGGHDLNQAELAELDKFPTSTISQVVEDQEERRALLTFLKVLRPTEHYGWSSEAPYEISQGAGGVFKCEAKRVPLPTSYN